MTILENTFGLLKASQFLIDFIIFYNELYFELIIYSQDSKIKLHFKM